MKKVHLIPPTLALIGSAAWLFSQNQTITELTNKNRLIKERIELVTRESPSSSSDLFGKQNQNKPDEFILEDGSVDWETIVRVMKENKVNGDPFMVRDLKTMIRLRHTILQLDAEELTAGLDGLRGLDGDREVIKLMRRDLIQLLGEIDPVLALEQIEEIDLGKDSEAHWLAQGAMGNLAIENPLAAANWLDRQIAAGRLESTTLHLELNPRLAMEAALIGSLAASDLEATKNRLAGFSTSELNHLLQTADFEGEEALSLFSGLARHLLPSEQASSAIVSRWSSHNYPGLSEASSALQRETFSPQEREQIVSNLAENFLNRSEAETRYQEESGKKDGLQHLLLATLGQYASENPRAAADWLLNHQKALGEGQTEMMKSTLLMFTAAGDLTEAISMVDHLQFENPHEALATVGLQVHSGQQDEFLEAIATHEFSPEQRQMAIVSLADSPFMKDFEAASAWLSEGPLNEIDRQVLIDLIHYNSIQESPGEWLGWLATHSSDPRSVTQEIVRNWTNSDFVSAGQWLQDQEPGQARNWAISAFAETVAPHRPSAAAKWAEALPAGENRINLLRQIHGSLLEQDPAAADALAERHGLHPPDE